MKLSMSQMQKEIVLRVKAFAAEYVIARLESHIAQRDPYNQESYNINELIVAKAVLNLPIGDLKHMFVGFNSVLNLYYFSNLGSPFRFLILQMIFSSCTDRLEVERLVEECIERAIEYEDRIEGSRKAQTIVEFLLATGRLLRAH